LYCTVDGSKSAGYRYVGYQYVGYQYVENWNGNVAMQMGNIHLLQSIAVIFLVLTLGTVVRLFVLRGAAKNITGARLGSLKTWWALAVVLSLACLLGNVGIILLIAACGAIGLHEFLKLLGPQVLGMPTWIALYAAGGIYYGFVFLGFDQTIRCLAPFGFLVVVSSIRSCLGCMVGYIRTTAGSYLGLMLFVYCLSHSYFVTTLWEVNEPAIGRVGWFLYLVVLTEVSDIAQAIVGRTYGATKIIPRTSPNKSLEGLAGGMVISMALAVAIAPWLTAWTWKAGWNGVGLAMLSGLVISVFGFLGGTHMSGIKRDAGVKDGSTLLPGQGGMIDRIDSLIFSAPAFYYFVLITTR